MKYLIIATIIISIVASLTLTSSAKALEGTSFASKSASTKAKLSYPITELGNCASVTDCRAYCNIPENITACIDFAKQKGFYKQPPTQTDILAFVKDELGCDSRQSCQQLCSNPDNFQKCREFAKKHKLEPPKISINTDSILSRAHLELGCDTLQSCLLVCAREENRERCLTFAKKIGLRGKEMEDKGRAVKPVSATQSANILPNLSTVAFGQYCKSNPGKCGEDGKLRYQQFLEFCQTSPEKCIPPNANELKASSVASVSAFPLQSYCTKYPGCRFDGARCVCGDQASQSAKVFGASTSSSFWSQIASLWYRLFGR